jgi:hypothetical protein
MVPSQVMSGGVRWKETEGADGENVLPLQGSMFSNKDATPFSGMGICMRGPAFRNALNGKKPSRTDYAPVETTLYRKDPSLDCDGELFLHALDALTSPVG